MAHMQQTKEPLDIDEKGAPQKGEPQTSNCRLYMQLQVFTGCRDMAAVQSACEASSIEAVIYRDANDPYGVGVLTLSEKDTWFVEEGRAFYQQKPFDELVPRPEMTMFGRTYSSGREPDLEDWLLHKPRRAAFHKDWRWAVWYPLRRKPAFATLPHAEQGKILFEHAQLGMRYGQAGMATDIRLASYGLDVNDNEFVLGLIGPELYPLSRLVQDMRKTKQTSEYIHSLGPFFVGYAHWRSQ